MKEKITLVNSSTNLATNETSTIATPIPDSIIELPEELRNKNASELLIRINEPLKGADPNDLANRLGSLWDGKESSIVVYTGPIINVINQNAPNARAYIGSKDESVNVADITPKEVFSELRRIISEHIKEEQERTNLISKVKELEESRGTEGFKAKYTEFITLAVAHMNLLAPILPALTQWL